VRSPFGWWPDNWGHHEGPQSVREPFCFVCVRHERTRGPLIAEQEPDVSGLSDAELPAQGAPRLFVGWAV
jgi:hypothetical protein